MIVLALRFLIVALIARSLLKLARGIAEGWRGPAAPRTPQGMALVRDPVCGTYVVPATALSSGIGAQARFFCSENCRRAYTLKLAQ
ncbi:MAG TPA: hypothetical protein VGI12_14210 [Vicinamibacterales bacterium]